MLKFEAFIMAVLMLFASFGGLIKPKFDNDFKIAGCDTEGFESGHILINGVQTKSDISGADEAFSSQPTYKISDKLTAEFTSKKQRFNFYGLRYACDSYLKGTITYTTIFGERNEEFFLEPSQEATEFYSFIDEYLNNRLGLKITKLTLEPLDREEAVFSLYGIATFKREVFDEYVYIENGRLKLGANLVWGGALSYLEDMTSGVEAVKDGDIIKVDTNASQRYGTKAVNKNVNLINRFDAGRLVQQSYYGTMDESVYECGTFMGNKWRYNPVQGGNVFKDASKIVDVRATDTEIYIKCRPMDWAKKKECITPSYMEATYSLDGNMVNVKCRFVDFSGYPSNTASQELPAFYPIEPLNRFVYYGGDEPWTNGELSHEDKLIFWPDAGYPHFSTTENWCAFTGEFDDSFSVGIYSDFCESVLAGVCDREGTTSKDPSLDSATSYAAIIGVFEFKSFAPFEYGYTLATGTVNEVRSSFESIK